MDKIGILGRHGSIMKAIYDRIDNVHKRPLHKGQIQIARDYFTRGMRIIMSQWGRSSGKALAIDTPILTPDGWKCMADIQVGDYVYGSDGNPTLVTIASEIQYNRKCYDVEFSDGSVITADADHLWETSTKLIRRSIKKNQGKLPKRSPIKKPQIFSTSQIKETLFWGKEANHSIPLAAPIYFEKKEQAIDPYVLGVWLGDGSSRGGAFYTNDVEIVREIERRGYATRKSKEPFRYAIFGIHAFLKEYNLLKNKHIPDAYLFGSINQRLDLLRGLLDTDGYCSKDGRIEFSNTNKNLSAGVKFLAESLGMKTTTSSKIPKCQNGKVGARAYLVHIVTQEKVFHLSRKAKNLKSTKIRSMSYRFIRDVVERDSVPVKCIGVAAPNHLFLAGVSLIPTHNTESALFIATVAALLNDNFIIYIITPERKQGKEIYWNSKRLPNYPPPEFIDTHKDSEIRTIFKNGSFIAIDGCENYNAHRGLKPNLVIYDEFQQHNREFHLEVMAPNLLAKNSSLIIYGTPPKRRSAFYVDFREQLLKQIKSGDATRSYYEFPSSLNPTIDPSELAKVRKELIESDNKIIWDREYDGKLVFGGEDVVFPKWNPADYGHVRTHRVAMSYLEHDKHKLKWYTICDPGTSSCFAVLFAAYNPFTQQIFILDEIYEKDRKRTDTRSIWERIQKIEKDLYPEAAERTWIRVYDEQATWFANEVSSNFHVGLIPSQKQRTTEETDISRIKMLMAQRNALIVSDRCYWFRWEIESCVTDENGEYVDRNNHLIDCLSGETKVETLDGPIEIAKLVGKRGYLYSRNGKISKFDSVRKIHTNVPMVEVEFSDGRKVKCTPNHKFLTVHDEWIEASCLLPQVLIQCNTYGSENNQREAARIQRESLLQIFRRKILQSWDEAIAQGCLGAFQWAYPKGIASSPFGWEYSQQLHPKSLLINSKATYQSSYDQRAPGGRSKAYDRDCSSSSESLAWNRRGSGMALSKFKEDVEEKAFLNKEMSRMRERISNQKLWESIFLPSKLQKQGQKEAAQVIGVRYAGSSDTYCMNVEDTHCFAVNEGIIVHNCAKYLMQATGWKLLEKGEDILYPEAPKSRPNSIQPEDWADDIVDKSLWVDSHDVYSDYFID